MSAFLQGDVVLLDMDPSRGHEPKGERPAIVVSSDLFNAKTALCVVVPVTTNTRPFATHFELPEEAPVWGCAVAEQPRCFDLRQREALCIGHLDCEGVFMRRLLTFEQSIYCIDPL